MQPGLYRANIHATLKPEEAIDLATRQRDGWTQLPPFMVPDEMAKAVDDAWHDLRYPNRTEALRAIIEAGIPALRAQKEAEKKAPKE